MVRRQGARRLPRAAKLRLLYKDGEQWKPVEAAGNYGVDRDRFNRVDFPPVTTRGLRLEVRLKPKFSGGILQWKIAAAK